MFFLRTSIHIYSQEFSSNVFLKDKTSDIFIFVCKKIKNLWYKKTKFSFKNILKAEKTWFVENVFWEQTIFSLRKRLILCTI